MMRTLRTRANFNRLRRLARVSAVLCTIVLFGTFGGFAQDTTLMHNAMPPVSPPGPLPEPFRIGSPRNQGSATEGTPSQAGQLYRQLRDIKLDPKKVYHIREASIEREDVHITLDDGTIGFTQAVDGRITGAFFEGEGEILLIPPDRVEKRSLGLFTKSAILEERFSSAFLRFNDDLAAQLDQYIRGDADDPQAFVDKWNSAVNSLSEADSLRLLTSFLNATPGPDGKLVNAEGDRMLRARIAGVRLGVFDLFFDTDAREQISVGQLSRDQYGRSFFNVWTAFPMRSKRVSATTKRTPRGRTNVSPAALGSTSEEEPEDRLRISGYKIKVDVKPPTDLEADCVMNAEVAQGGQRVVLLELSRFLKVSRIELDGKPVEFLQNEALEGTALDRRGNDLVAIIFPQSLVTGQKLQLHFVYGGSVMSDAGGGLLYVGAKGIWYPNRGVSMANFDLEFSHPTEWTLVATGHRITDNKSSGIETSHWVTDRPIPLAGFNLGNYQRAEARLGSVPIEVYAAEGVEHSLPAPKQEIFASPYNPANRRAAVNAPIAVAVAPPSPSSHAQSVADRVKKGLESLSDQMGPYPYHSLVLSQIPGHSSQGWPGLIFLSSYVFLTPDEMERAHISGVNEVLYSTLMPIHESAHQWWGDLVSWKGYRDQWLVEALANYCALVAMEKDHPKEVQEVLLSYRKHLLEPTQDGHIGADAGPVTLGVRLYSSYFPNGYDAISYGRGTWMFHMLRTMLRDADATSTAPRSAKKSLAGEEPFFRVLRKLRERYEGKYINNRIVQQVFEEEVPESLRFDGRKSLDWFFDEWINGTAIPKIEAGDVRITKAPGKTVIAGKLKQEDAPPELVTSVPIYSVAAGKNYTYLGRVFVDGPESAFRITAPAGVTKIEVDPYLTILRRP